MSRRIRIAAGLLLFLVCAVASYQVTLAVMAEPAGARDFSAEANAILERVLPEGEDATPLLIEYTKRWDELPTQWETETGTEKWTLDLLHLLQVGEWNDSELSFAHEVWSQISLLLSLLHGAAERDALRAPYVMDNTERQLIASLAINRITSSSRELLRIAIRDAAERQAWDEVEGILETTLRLAHLFGQRPSIEDGFAAGILVSSPLMEIAFQSQERRIPREVCERLIAVIDRVDPIPAPIESVFEIERLRMSSLLARIFSQSGYMVLWMEGRLSLPRHEVVSPPSLTERLANIRSLFEPRRSTVEKALHEQFRALAAWWNAPPEEKPAQLENLVYAERSSRWLWSYGLGYNENMVAHRFRARKTISAGARAALRIAAFRDAHGRWPESIEEAMPDEETLDPLTGEPWEYVLTHQDRYGKPYRLATPPQPNLKWSPGTRFAPGRLDVIDFTTPRTVLD